MRHHPPSPSLADVGQYNCRVSDGSMTTTSDGVVINVEGECNGDTF